MRCRHGPVMWIFNAKTQQFLREDFWWIFPIDFNNKNPLVTLQIFTEANAHDCLKKKNGNISDMCELTPRGEMAAMLLYSDHWGQSRNNPASTEEPIPLRRRLPFSIFSPQHCGRDIYIVHRAPEGEKTQTDRDKNSQIRHWGGVKKKNT